MGRDRVARRATGIVVYAAHDMPDWQVRRYRRTAVWYAGRRFVVARRTPLDGSRVRFALDPWPEDGRDPPGLEIRYDEDYVRARDARHAFLRRVERRRPLLLAALPLLGLLPSGVKARIHIRYGVSPHLATQASLWLEWVVLLLCGALATIFTIGGRPPGAPRVLVLLAAAAIVAIDAFFRFSSLLEERDEPPGFLEWLLRRR